MIIHQFLAIKDISLLFESVFASSRLIFSRHHFSDIFLSDIFLSDIFFPVLFSGISEKRYNLKNRKNWMYMQSGFTAWHLSE